jgi:ABC-type polysaccharide/polyol phosphate export permease
MHIESWMVTAAVVLLIALVVLVVGLLSRVCSSLCHKLEKCGERGEWPCRS